MPCKLTSFKYLVSHNRSSVESCQGTVDQRQQRKQPSVAGAKGESLVEGEEGEDGRDQTEGEGKGSFLEMIMRITEPTDANPGQNV